MHTSITCWAFYQKVASAGLPNFMGAMGPVPTNLHISEWRRVAITGKQHQVVAFLKFGFPTGFEGADPSHPSPIMVSANITHANHQLPLDPVDWPLICFMEGDRYFTDVSLPFCMRWAASAWQDTTSVVAQHLNKQGACALNYIDNFEVVAPTQAYAQDHFEHLQDLLTTLGLDKAKHKASPPSQQMIQLGL